MKDATTATAATTKNEEVKNMELDAWFDKNLGALDCEQSAWMLCQTVTTLDQSREFCKHVHSDGTNIYATSGSALLVMQSPVLPVGVYDPALVGKGKAKRRAFLPMNSKNEAKMLKDFYGQTEKNVVYGNADFDFSINQPLNSEVFSLLYFLAVVGKGCVLSDEAVNLITASCQQLNISVGDKYVICKNDLLAIVLMAIRPKRKTSRILSTIEKFTNLLPPPEAKPEKVEAKPEKVEAKPEKVEAKPEKVEAKPEDKIKQIAKKYKK